MTLNMIKHLSVSAIQDYLECPMRWAGRRVFGWSQETQKNELARALGWSVHRALTTHHRGGDAELDLLATLNGRNGGKGIRHLLSMSQLTDILTTLGKYVDANDYAAADRPALWFEIKVAGVALKFVGEFDLVRDDELAEFKTTSSGTWWSQKRVDTELQADAYWEAFTQTRGHAPQVMRYHILSIGGPKVGQLQMFETNRGATNLAGFEGVVQAAYNGMTSAPLVASCLTRAEETLTGTPHNGRCVFQHNCPRWAVQDLERLSERYLAWQQARATHDLDASLTYGEEIETMMKDRAPEANP